MISFEDLALMLDLLIAIGPVHIKQYDEDKDDPNYAEAKENGIEVILLTHAKIARIPVIAPPTEIMLTIHPQRLVVPSSTILQRGPRLERLVRRLEEVRCIRIRPR